MSAPLSDPTMPAQGCEQPQPLKDPMHSTAPATPVSGPAQRARSLSLIVATAAAVVPTGLAAQGMVSVGHDVLALPLGVAVALAAFLELGLVASALLARASALARRPVGADAVATWVLSTISGALSATHELIGPVDQLTGQRGWQSDSASLLAAGVRLVAPLVAAWLWERVLTSARRDLASRSMAEIRRSRRLLAVARAALTVRRREAAGVSAWRIGHARRRLDRAHIALLRLVPATDTALSGEITTWLAMVGHADTYPATTSPMSAHLSDTRADTGSDTARVSDTTPDTVLPVADTRSDSPATVGQVVGLAGHQSDSGALNGRHVSDTLLNTLSDNPARPANLSDTGPFVGVVARAVSDTDIAHPNPVVEESDPLSDTVSTVSDRADFSPAVSVEVSDGPVSDERRVFDAVAIVSAFGALSGADMATQMGRRGHRMTERTGLRWRVRAEDLLLDRPLTAAG